MLTPTRRELKAAPEWSGGKEVGKDRIAVGRLTAGGSPARGVGKAAPDGKEIGKDRIVAAGALQMTAGGSPAGGVEVARVAGAPPGCGGGGTQSWWSRAQLKADRKRTAPVAIDTAAALAAAKAREAAQCGEFPEESGSVGLSLSPGGSLGSLLSGASTPLGSSPLGSSRESTPPRGPSPFQRWGSAPVLGLGGGVDARVLLRLGDALCEVKSMDKILELSRGVQQEELTQRQREEAHEARQREVQHCDDPAGADTLLIEVDFSNLEAQIDAVSPAAAALTLKRSSEHIMQGVEEEDLFSSAPPTKRSFASAPSPEASSVIVESLHSIFSSALRLDAYEAGEQEQAAAVGLLAELDFLLGSGDAAPAQNALPTLVPPSYPSNQPASPTRSPALAPMYLFF
jgi:hypothetical protein